MKKYKFSVIVTQDQDGVYTAKVPELPGCHTQAKDLAVLYERIEEAIELCVEVHKNKKESLPISKFIGVQEIEIAA